MAIATWPSQLQDKLNADSFDYKFGSVKIRSDVDVGVAKVRRRYTKQVDTLTASILLQYEDFQTFQDFYYVTLNGGTEQFTFTNPLTAVTTNFRMVDDPDIRAIGGRVFEISMQWEIIPT